MTQTSETLIIMRHGFRADTAGQPWKHQVTRPWDPPLATEGWKEAWRTGLSLSKFIEKPDIVITSPYTRCLQTASAVVKAFRLEYDRLAIDKGLSESYDWYNAVRYVASDDISRRGHYKNMGEWFYCCRKQALDNLTFQPEWRLMPCTSTTEMMSLGVYDYWKEPASKRKKIREFGKFPDFEMYMNLGINDGVSERRARYVRALNRCIRLMMNTQPRKKHKVGVLVSHMAGVGTMYEHLTESSPAHVKTAGYFVVRRENGGTFRLVTDSNLA